MVRFSSNWIGKRLAETEGSGLEQRTSNGAGQTLVMEDCLSAYRFRYILAGLDIFAVGDIRVAIGGPGRTRTFDQWIMSPVL